MESETQTLTHQAVVQWLLAQAEIAAADGALGKVTTYAKAARDIANYCKAPWATETEAMARAYLASVAEDVAANWAKPYREPQPLA